MHINSRKSWRARRPGPRDPQSDNTIREFFLHHPADPHDLSHIDTDMEQDAYMRAIQAFHMDERGWSDIGYSFVVFQDGEVCRGRGRRYIPAAQLGHNTGTIAVLCALGNGENPTGKMFHAIVDLKNTMDRLVGRDLRVRAHGDVTPTECPGPEVRRMIPDLNRS